MLFYPSFAILLQRNQTFTNDEKRKQCFGKVTHDNLPQAVEHLIKMMEEQAQNSKNNMSVEDDEISIEEVSSLIKKSVSTIYRYTCQNSIPHSKQGNTLHFYRSEILEWMKMHKKKCINELSDEAHIESFRVLNRD